MVSSRLLPHNAQVATPEAFAHALLGSRLISEGSMQVAAWVAALEQNIPFNYGLKDLRVAGVAPYLENYAQGRKKGVKSV